jgi:excisionase family DNA binding protein
MNRPPLTVAEAMRALGVSDSTVRRMLKVDQLREHSRDAGGRILIDPDSVDAAAVALGRAELAGSEVRRELAPTMTTLAEVVSSLTETIERQQQQITDMAIELGEARATARLLPMRAEEAEQRATALAADLERTRAELQQARQEIDALRSAAYAQEQVTRQPEKPSLRARISRLLRRE